jgi:hypothetical protein
MDGVAGGTRGTIVLGFGASNILFTHHVPGLLLRY